MNDFNAVAVTGNTLVGCSGPRPQEHGNCFTVRDEEGKGYRILNFNYENLEALEAKGLKFPIKCREIRDHLAIFHDPRIGERWYQVHYCTVCCPKDLLQPFQLQARERDVMRGRIIEHGNSTEIRLLVEPEFK